MLGTNDPFDIFHLKILSQRHCFSVKAPSFPSVTTPPHWDCSVSVLPQPLLLQLCTFLPASVRKETGNSSHPHSSCAIPPLLLQWRRLALVTRGQELSYSEGQEDRSVFMPLLGWGPCWGYLLSSFLYCFSFRSSFYNAQPKHPVFKTSDCFAPEELMLWCISLKCKTILLIQEVIKVETKKLMNKSKKAICGYRKQLSRV